MSLEVCQACARASCGLASAARGGREACVRHAIARGALIDAYVDLSDDVCGMRRTALMWASSSGHAGCVRLLVEAGAKTQLLGECSRAALAYASAAGEAECVRVLLLAGAEIHALNSIGQAALHEACCGCPELDSKCAEVAALLIAHGARYNERDGVALSPLYTATLAGRARTVRVLIEARADVNAKDCVGETALVRACQRAIHPHYAEIARMLVAAGADVVEASRAGGAVPLGLASEAGDGELVRLLLANKASACWRGPQGDDGLCWWAARSAPCLAQLLDAGADPNLPGLYGFPAMERACAAFDLRCVQLLSSYGAKRRFSRAVRGEATAEEVVVRAMRVYECTHARPAESSSGWRNGKAVLDWLVASREWSSSLHHIDVLTPARALALLRTDADLHARANGGPTPLQLARTALRVPPALLTRDMLGVAQLIIAASEPWSPATHRLFPASARERALVAMMLGKRVAARLMAALDDVWLTLVMPSAITRA